MSNAGPALRQLRDVLRQIIELAPTAVGTEEIEPHLVRLVEIIERNTESTAEIKDEFVRLVGEHPPGAVEILQFVMHRYHWDEVREEVTKGISDSSDRRWQFALRGALAAFDPNWEDRDIFATYRDE